MGQKSRHKKNRQKTSQPAAQRQVPAPSRTGLASLSGGAQSTAPATTGFNKPAATSLMDQTAEYVRGDITRIALLLVVLVLILVTLFLTNVKTPVLKNAGKQVVNFLRLQ